MLILTAIFQNICAVITMHKRVILRKKDFQKNKKVYFREEDTGYHNYEKKFLILPFCRHRFMVHNRFLPFYVSLIFL